MQLPNKVIFPLHCLNLMKKQRTCIHDTKHLGFLFEEYDSSDTEEMDWTRLVDCFGRPLNAKVELMHEFRSIELASLEPDTISLDLIDEFEYLPPQHAWPPVA